MINSLFGDYMKNFFSCPWAAIGILVLRLGIGFEMVVYGWPKITAGTTVWEHSGAALSGVLGIHFMPAVWGFFVALTQALGGLLIVVGLFTRPAAFALAFVMGLAAVMVFQTTGGNFKEWSHPAEAAVACLAIALIGAGRFGLDSYSLCACKAIAPKTPTI
ncbi:DoxX family protein [Propionivibrio sp.]|uniref:DoxX family protein n=1 Tax=Propionivibrio sp. TaxID=2212460 RepID=UPI003BF17E1C